MRRPSLIASAAAGLLAIAGALDAVAATDSDIRINQIQVLG
jgi:hypothetical protein